MLIAFIVADSKKMRNNLFIMQKTSKTVADYMRREIATIREGGTLAEAVGIMLEKKTNGLVVTDTSGKVVGILSSWDILHLIVPDYLEEDMHLASFEAGATFFDSIREHKEVKIDSFMTKSVHTTRQDHTLMEAATLLTEHRIRQLPVVNDEGILVGHISRTDIKRAIGDALELPIPPRD